jgi:hypothetical protein
MALVKEWVGVPKVRWTKSDVKRLSTKTLRQQLYAADMRLIDAQYRFKTSKDDLGKTSFGQRVVTLTEYIEAINQEIANRKGEQ